VRQRIYDLLAKPYPTGGLQVLSHVHLLASVHPTRTIKPQGRLMVAPFCAHASMLLWGSWTANRVNVLKSEICS
jgi:hypothetical protein